MMAWELWVASSTQLRTSFGGVIGLDYTAAEIAARAKGLIKRSLAEKKWLFEGLQVLETAFLKAQHTKSESSKRKARSKKGRR
jgi:hypothetical protein